LTAVRRASLRTIFFAEAVFAMKPYPLLCSNFCRSAPVGDRA
jgi:hypothetical protein